MSRKSHPPHLFVFAVCCGAIIMFVLVTLGGFFSATQLWTEETAAVLPPVLIRLANDDRATAGVTSLTINPLLQKAAEAKARDMATKGYFSHQAPDGKSPWDFIHAAGYQFASAGENLGVNFNDSAKLQHAWMLSPTHRKNLLNGHFSEIGIGTAEGAYKGKPATYVVEYFASPAKAE